MTQVRHIQARVLLSTVKQPDPWFGLKYSMNLYRGCQHRCIYCDSRSQCYGIEDFDGEVLVKTNAPEQLRRELARKRSKGYIGTGSMNDPYMPLERELNLTGRVLQVIAEFGFPVHILTKSDLVLRDIDALVAIARAAPAAGSRHGGAVVSFTITTADDHLARKVEPGAPAPSARFAAMAALTARGISAGVMLMPVLPFLEDTAESITQVVERACECGAAHVVAAFGMTLRDRQRKYYYAQLDRLSPGLRARYERAFGSRYFAPARQAATLQATFQALAERRGLAGCVPPFQPLESSQLRLL